MKAKGVISGTLGNETCHPVCARQLLLGARARPWGGVLQGPHVLITGYWDPQSVAWLRQLWSCYSCFQVKVAYFSMESICCFWCW